jgi:hypothetical protein
MLLRAVTRCGEGNIIGSRVVRSSTDGAQIGEQDHQCKNRQFHNFITQSFARTKKDPNAAKRLINASRAETEFTHPAWVTALQCVVTKCSPAPNLDFELPVFMPVPDSLRIPTPIITLRTVKRVPFPTAFLPDL